MGSPLLNFRVDDDLADAIDEAAKGVGVARSVYLREIIAAVVLGGVTIEELRIIIDRNGKQGEQPHPDRYLTLQIQEARSLAPEQGCKHPVTARKRLPFTILCGVCGDVVKRT